MFNSNQRSHESPMDFEWANHQGPVDVTSPFHQLSQQGTLRRGFDSPSKPEVRSQTSVFFSAPSAPIATPFRNPSFTTPRKPFDADLFSETSGAESSPADNADAEDTPEIPVKTKPVTLFKSEKKPLFGKYGAGFLGTSPGRHDSRRGKYAEVVQKASAAQKARKRKRFDRDYHISSRRSSYDTESENEDVRQRHLSKNNKEHEEHFQQNHHPEKAGWFTNFLDGLASRPHLPLVLSYYVQFGINAFIGSCFMWVIYKIYSTIREDISLAADKAIQKMQSEVAKCVEDYTINQCARGTRVPLLEEICQTLELCMERDATSVGRTTVSARMLSDIFSEFADGMTFKAIFLFIAILAIGLIANNTMFSNFRAKAMEQQHQYYSQPPPPTPHPAHHYAWDIPPPQVPLPPTPRHISNEYQDYGMGSPMKAIMPSQRAQGSPRKTSRY